MKPPSSRPSRAMRFWEDPRIIAPDAETWERMTLAERDDAVERVLSALDEYREAMSEGVRHFRAKSGTAADLEGHFRRAGRQVFIACELAVLYPGEATIVPDVLAVMDCDPDLDLNSWNVADQKRGIDLIIEVRNEGKKHKDLIENVADYARLQIPEYFSFDVRSKVLRGWRLPAPRARSYQPILPQRGHYSSGVLGLDLTVIDGKVRFFANEAMVPTAGELLTRLQVMVDQSLDAVAESQKAVVESQKAVVESQRAAAEATERATRLTATLAVSVLRLCERKGITLDARQHARVISESDGDRLARWLDQALAAESSNDLFVDD